MAHAAKRTGGTRQFNTGDRGLEKKKRRPNAKRSIRDVQRGIQAKRHDYFSGTPPGERQGSNQKVGRRTNE